MSNPVHSRRLAWHYWISALRLTAGVVALPSSFVSFYGLNSQIGMVTLAPWLLVIVTDVFLLTVDLWRTSAFSASFFAQLVFTSISAIALILSSVLLIRNQDGGIMWAIFLVVPPQLFAALYSIGLCVSLALAFREAKSQDPEVSWMVNGKDLIAGTIDTSARTTLFGRKRIINLKPYIFPTRHTFVNFGGAIGAYGVKVFLRRVSPVETKRYAFIRNTVALVAIAVIVVRAVTLLTQAQGEVFESKSITEDCTSDWAKMLMKDVKILVRHYGDDSPLLNAYDHAQQNYSLGLDVRNSRGVFDLLLEEVTYNFTMTTRNATSLLNVKPPQIWLAHDSSNSGYTRQLPDVTPWLVASWQLIPGLHLEAETTLAKRKFITSPFLRDTVAGAKPIYETTPMFPIATTYFAPLNNNSIATGKITPVLRPIFTSSTNRKMIQDLKVSSTPMPITCEVVEDYRSSTALDALGSIGGLLAILQGLHLLLFGRPLFWGIAGTKLINPFGLFGGCSSRGFRRRLREHYHVPPNQFSGESRNEDEIRMTAFLRDFVIDLGPADIVETSPFRRSSRDIGTVEKDKDLELGAEVQLLPVLNFSPARTEHPIFTTRN
ncbi:hypothetical protein BDV93DRAFT_604461 [Ceratobasidium sp. AG-I]|nr:hypothetical protein BDV93DRAFT_604461 [Ceratobasidium sp. AG-I]